LIETRNSAVPQAANFLDPQPLSKGKTEKAKSKKKDAAKANQPLETGFMTLPAAQPMPHTDSPGPSTDAPMASNGLPTPTTKRGFSKIASLVDGPSSGPSVPSDRTKVVFGFGTKRKMGEEADGTPPPKRR
jgi:U4/U6.U5 tri-snRNP-associated protein 1